MLPGDPQYAPYLLIYLIDSPSEVSNKDEAAFSAMLSRYAYLKSHEHHQGFSASKLRSTSSLRWLLVQVFQNLDVDHSYLHLKKKEAKHWWYKNGWENVSPAFHKLKEARSEVNGSESV